MDEAREQRIRERAYAIWEREGRPDDRHLLHWWLASEEIEREGTLPGRWASAAERLPSAASFKSGGSGAGC